MDISQTKLEARVFFGFLKTLWVGFGCFDVTVSDDRVDVGAENCEVIRTPLNSRSGPVCRRRVSLSQLRGTQQRQ